MMPGTPRNEPMHVAVVTANPIATGGMQTFSRFLIDTILQAGQRVTVALSGHNIYGDLYEQYPHALEIDPVEWVDDTTAGDRDYQHHIIIERKKWFRRAEADVAVFIQSSNTPFRCAAIGARAANTPILITHRTMPWIKDFVPIGKHFGGLISGLGLHNRKLIRQTRGVAKAADRIVYNSAAVRREYERIYHYPPSKGRVIRNALNEERLPLNSINNEHQPTTVGYLGRLAAEKRIDVLLKAFARLPTQFASRVLLYGEGPEEASLRRLAEQLNITDRVEFRGNTSNVAAAYAQMDIVCLCSRREASSNTVLEALAAGKAVIVSDVGGLPELVDQGRCGRIVPIGDESALAVYLQQLIAEPNVRLQLGRDAMHFVRKQHDHHSIARQWLTLLHETACITMDEYTGLPTEATEPVYDLAAG